VARFWRDPFDTLCLQDRQQGKTFASTKEGYNMTGRIIVLVSDLDDSSHGEINVLETPEQAAHFVETLLESGFEQDRLRVFGGDEMAMQVHHRPVVSLMNPDQPQNGRGRKEEVQREAAPEPQVVAEEQTPVARVAAAPAPRAARNLEYQEVVAAEPFVQNGVRFSSMFKPA
jgi:hypothetical protein